MAVLLGERDPRVGAAGALLLGYRGWGRSIDLPRLRDCTSELHDTAQPHLPAIRCSAECSAWGGPGFETWRGYRWATAFTVRRAPLRLTPASTARSPPSVRRGPPFPPIPTQIFPVDKRGKLTSARSSPEIARHKAPKTRARGASRRFCTRLPPPPGRSGPKASRGRGGGGGGDGRWGGGSRWGDLGWWGRGDRN